MQKRFLPVRCGKGVLLAAILVLQVFLLQAKSSEFIPTTADDGTQTPTMEVTDLFSRTTTITITGGMKLFFPQRKEIFMDGDKLIVCNAQGDPVNQVDLNQISCIKFINFPKSAFSPKGLEKAERDGDRGWSLMWRVDDQDYFPLLPGELTFSDDLQAQTLLTAKGKEYTIPMERLEMIQYRDTVVGVGQQLWAMKDDAQLFFWAFNNGTSQSEDYMHIHHYTNFADDGGLNFSLFVPTDEALRAYPDVSSFTSQIPRVLCLENNGNSRFPVTARLFRYADSTGICGNELFRMERMSQENITSHLTAILRSHTILHNRAEDRAKGLRSGNEYYVAMDGSVVKVVLKNGEPTAVQGGFQLWNEAHGLQTMATENTDGQIPEGKSLTQCNILASRQKGNGWIYKTDGAMNFTPQSVYGVLTANGTFPEDNPFKAFVDLCTADQELISAFMDRRELNTAENILQPLIFLAGQQSGGTDYNLNFVDNIPFTLYVPTNEAIQKEIAAGLPTWEDIAADYQACEKDEETGALKFSADSTRLQEKCMKLMNFVKAHIQFGTEIADQLPFERTHNTALVKPTTLATPKLIVKGLGKGKMTVTDECGNTRNIVDAHKNLFTRDIVCTIGGKLGSPTGLRSMNNVIVKRYASGVVHQIDGVLSYK